MSGRHWVASVVRAAWLQRIAIEDCRLDSSRATHQFDPILHSHPQEKKGIILRNINFIVHNNRRRHTCVTVNSCFALVNGERQDLHRVQ